MMIEEAVVSLSATIMIAMSQIISMMFVVTGIKTNSVSTMKLCLIVAMMYQLLSIVIIVLKHL